MRHVITFVLVATILLVSVVVAHPGMMNKECWENRPTVVSESSANRDCDWNVKLFIWILLFLQKPTDCCKGLTMLPEAALEECNKLYPEEDDNVEEAQDNNDDDNDDDEDDSEDKKKPHHHHHHHHHHGKHPCIVECYFNKTGVFKDLQVVKATALKLFSDNTDSSGTFQATLSASIDTCIVERGWNYCEMIY